MASRARVSACCPQVFQGILMVRPADVQAPQMLVKLWLHECSRVFHTQGLPAGITPSPSSGGRGGVKRTLAPTG